MSLNYTTEFKNKIVRLHEEEGRTYKSITAEYGVSKASISKWCSEFRKECQTSPQAKEDYDSMKENLRLKRENEEFGIRWLLRRLGICPNAYYNYRKHRKTD